MNTKTHLGKNINSLNLGLKELLSEFNASTNLNEISPGPTSDQIKKLPIDLLQPGKYQPRKAFNQASLEELATSIRSQGLLQPIIVRPGIGKNYEIIAGERRWRAAQLAGLNEVPIIFRKLTDEQALAISLIENIQRENLNVIDEAEALQRLSSEFSMTHQEVAKAIGKSRATVTNLLRLLSLNDEVKEMVLNGDLEMGHARALLMLSSWQQTQAAKTIVAKKLSVRDTEKLVQGIQNKKLVHTFKRADANILRLQQELEEKLGARVTIKQQTKNKGQLVIQYKSLEELDGILEHIMQ